LPGGDGDEFGTGGAIDFVLEQCGDFPPPEDLPRGVAGQVAGGADLLDTAAGQTGGHGRRDPGVELITVAGQDHAAQAFGGGRFGEDCGGGLSGLQAEFQTAGHAARIARVDDGQTGRIELTQTREHGVERHSPHLVTDDGIDGGQWGETGRERLEIKSTAADDQWSSAAGDDVFDRSER